MVTCLILAIIAIAGAEYLYRGQATLINQRNSRVALAVANGRLEDVRASSYGSLTNVMGRDFVADFVIFNGSTWVLGSNETVRIGATLQPVSTTFQFVDADYNESNSYDCVKVTVSVGYRPGSSDRVVLQTVRAP